MKFCQFFKGIFWVRFVFLGEKTFGTFLYIFLRQIVVFLKGKKVRGIIAFFRVDFDLIRLFGYCIHFFLVIHYFT